jgi:hypothetical protein
MKEVIVLELNEVSPVILERLTESGKCPNFRRLRDSHVQVPTYAAENYRNLEPWIQWITVHTGLSQSEHKVFNLSDGQHASCDQLWDQLEDAGIGCGIVSPINSRRGRIRKGFYVPDPWSASDDAYPQELERIYRFLRDRIRSHDVTLDAGESKISFLWDSVREGVRAGTLLRLGVKYLLSRLDRRRRWRLVVDYDRYLLDLALARRAKLKTSYTSVYLNSVAHYQHRYWTRHDAEWWSEKAPGLFKHENPLEGTDLRSGDDPITHGVISYDEMIGRILDTCPEAELVVLSGLSQVPFEGDESGHGLYLYRPYDHNALFTKLGVSFERIVPLISRDLMIYFRHPNHRKEAIDIISGASVEGEKLFLCTEESDYRLFVKVGYTLPVCPGTLITLPGSAAPLVFKDWLQLITFKTGHHANEGLAIIPRHYEPLIKLDDKGQLQLQYVHALLLNLIRSATGIEVHAPVQEVSERHHDHQADRGL